MLAGPQYLLRDIRFLKLHSKIVLFDIFGDKRREEVALANIPDHIKEATIAAEDKDFYRHQGFDIKGLIRGVILKPLTLLRNPVVL